MVSRDTSADAMAAAIAEQTAREAGACDPPLTLDGRNVKLLEEAMTKADAALERAERTKIYRDAQIYREARAKLGTAIAYLSKRREIESGASGGPPPHWDQAAASQPPLASGRGDAPR